MRISLLDFKLGLRMLVRYPGLTLVGGFALAFAICIGAGTFEFVRRVVFPSLPLPGGDRIVAIRNWDAAENRADLRSLSDFAAWRGELETVEQLGAYRTLHRNLEVEGTGIAPVDMAEVSASAFRVSPVRPLLGRMLIDADEQPGGGALVAVIGYDLWQRRFGSDTDVIGRVVRVGAAPTTIVGVMPAEFGFPSGELWMRVSRFWPR